MHAPTDSSWLWGLGVEGWDGGADAPKAKARLPRRFRHRSAAIQAAGFAKENSQALPSSKKPRAKAARTKAHTRNLIAAHPRHAVDRASRARLVTTTSAGMRPARNRVWRWAKSALSVPAFRGGRVMHADRARESSTAEGARRGGRQDWSACSSPHADQCIVKRGGRVCLLLFVWFFLQQAHGHKINLANRAPQRLDQRCRRPGPAIRRG